MATRTRRQSLRRRLALGGLALLGLIAGALPSHKHHSAPSIVVPVASASAKPISAAYVYDRAGLSFNPKDGALLDQLNYSFALIQNGKATGAHWQNIGTFKAFIASSPHIRPVLSVGGWGADGFSQACMTQEGRETLSDSIIALMEKHGFLGVDIDWEYPCSSAAGIASDPSDKQNFTLLLKSLRAKLDALEQADGKERLLAIAVGGDPVMTKYIECSAVGAIVDQVNVMTYDLHAGASKTTHHTALYSTPNNALSADAAISAYRAAGIPANKMMIGAAFYGRGWSNVKTQNNGLSQSTNKGSLKNVSYQRVIELVNGGKSTAYYDSDAQAAYLFDGSSFVSYDNTLSVKAKGRYAVKNGLMGMMCWEYGGDVNSELLTALHDSLSN